MSTPTPTAARPKRVEKSQQPTPVSSARGVLVPRPGWAEVVRHVAWLTATPAEEIMSRCRRRDLVDARNLVCWLAHRYLNMSWVEIVEHMGKNPTGHSTALMAGRRQQKVLDWTQRQIYLAAEALLVQLKAEEAATTQSPPLAAPVLETTAETPATAEAH
jgi:hypothetical protein